MSWFNLGWTPNDTELVKKWQGEKGKLVPIVDETRADPQADDVSWIYGEAISEQVQMPLFDSVPKPQLRRGRKRIPFTQKERLAIFASLGRSCVKCEKHTDLQIHHIDEDPSNNNLENLEVLCYTCHKNLHRTKVPIQVTQDGKNTEYQNPDRKERPSLTHEERNFIMSEIAERIYNGAQDRKIMNWIVQTYEFSLSGAAMLLQEAKLRLKKE